MIVYRVKVSVEQGIEVDWLKWMRGTHIPDVLATGYFTGHRISRVLDPTAADLATYTIEYHCDSLAAYDTYQTTAAPALQKDHTERYQGRFQASRILSEVLEASDSKLGESL